MADRDFKGVWIPKAVWLDPRLSALEKVILTEIDSLDGDAGCWASNQHLAEFCQCSESKVSRAVKKLTDLKLIYVAAFDGRRRVLRSSLSKKPRLPEQKAQTGPAKCPESNTGNNTESNTEIFSCEICDLLNKGKAQAGSKGRLKPATGSLILPDLFRAGILQSQIRETAQEAAQGGQNLDWFTFEKKCMEKWR